MYKWQIDFMKKCLHIGVINTEANREILKEAVHKEIMGVSVVLRQIIEEDAIGIVSGILTKKAVKELGMSEEEVWKLAWENTKRNFPPKLINLKSQFEEIIGLAMPGEYTREYYLTSRKNQYGAVYFLNEKLLQTISKKFRDSLYILPSSVHEVIVIREGDVEEGKKELKELVIDANKDIFNPKDILSNNVYHYDIKNGLTIVV